MEYKDRQTNVNYEECLDYVRRSSNPSKLRITDVKFTKVDLPPWGCYLVRIDTNQGISGYGEMRDGASATYLKYLKSRIVGENPCEVDRIFRKIKQFGGPARQAAGVCAIELALWDLAGKAYGVPVYQLLGGRFRDKVRLYADTHIEEGRATGILMEPEKVGRILKGYMDQGFTVVKILSVELLMAQEGNYCGPLDWVNELRAVEEKVRQVTRTGTRAESSAANAQLYDFNRIPHPFTNMHVTEQEDGLHATDESGAPVTISPSQPVSMNMWGLPASFVQELEKGFPVFLDNLKEGDIKSEYLLPKIIDNLVQNKKARVTVLDTPDKWFGVTYREDKQAVADAIRGLIQSGVYKEKLF